MDDITQRGRQVALLVGLATAPPLLADWSVIHASYGAVSPVLLAQVRPDCVACPLLAAEFDAAQLAQRLEQIGFVGRLLVMAPALPDRRMVAREIASAAPGLRVEILTEG